MKAKMVGSGWHGQTLRHSNARRLGKAGGNYANAYYKGEKIEFTKLTHGLVGAKAPNRTSQYLGIGKGKKKAFEDLKKSADIIDEAGNWKQKNYKNTCGQVMTDPVAVAIHKMLKPVKSDKAYNKSQLAKGTKVEMEHTTDKETAETIAKHHLDEDKDYYKKLELIEKPKPKKKIFIRLEDDPNLPDSKMITVQTEGYPKSVGFLDDKLQGMPNSETNRKFFPKALKMLKKELEASNEDSNVIIVNGAD